MGKSRSKVVMVQVDHPLEMIRATYGIAVESLDYLMALQCKFYSDNYNFGICNRFYLNQCSLF